MPTARSQSISLALHVLSVALLLILTSQSLQHTPPPATPKLKDTTLLAPPPRFLVHVIENHGGGSNRSPEQARRGIPPPRSYRTFIPPVSQPDPKLAILPTIDFDVPVINVSGTDFGDPTSTIAKGAFGDKGGSTIGNYRGGRGIGDKDGLPGVSARFSHPTRPAELIYRVEPEFSEDARKAKFQGMVVLMIEISTDGRPQNASIVENPGLGLGDKAIEAVQKWRFRPALRGATPIVSTARVEVYFHLL